MKIEMILAVTLMSEPHIVDLLTKAGFPEKSHATMVCIAKHESGFNPKAVNTNRDGSKDLGLFQINERIWGKHCPWDLMNPELNIDCAKLVYDTQGLTAWVAYKRTCNNYKLKSCPKTVIKDFDPDRAWDAVDKMMFERVSREGCFTRGGCVLEFWRYPGWNYHAECGAPL